MEVCSKKYVNCFVLKVTKVFPCVPIKVIQLDVNCIFNLYQDSENGYKLWEVESRRSKFIIPICINERTTIETNG